MDSLELPIDLIWEGKIEPLSPNQLALVNSEDIMIFDNDFPADLILNHANVIFDGKQSPEEILLELQQEIAEQDDDSNESTQWLDEPICLPIPVEYNHHPLPQRQPLKIDQTAQLMREFHSVLDSVELTHLTPPQTPPESPQIENLTDLRLDQFVFSSTPQPQQQIILNANFFNFDQAVQSPACSQDIAREMEVVEELVRSHAENLPEWTSDDDYSSQASSSPNSSPRSTSDDSFDNASQSNDDEWTPTSTPTPSKRRVRSSEDKKSRKKEQNKNAATRYRQKKKAESEVVMGEERELQEKNNQLQVKYTDIQREIKYLKSLMRELYHAKGLL